jgi:cell division protein FtsB
VENDVKQLAITQTETRTLVSETRTRVGGLEDEVKKLAAGQETLEDEVKKLAAGQEIVRDEVKKLSTGQESLRALIEERLPKPAR